MRPNDITVVCGDQEDDGSLCRWQIAGIPGSPPGVSDAAVKEALRRLGEHVLDKHAVQDEQEEMRRGRETLRGRYEDLLTPDEHKALSLTGELAGLLLRICGPDAPADVDELIHHLHVIQRYVGSQAAARAFPGSFRLLGRHLADS